MNAILAVSSLILLLSCASESLSAFKSEEWCEDGDHFCDFGKCCIRIESGIQRFYCCLLSCRSQPCKLAIRKNETISNSIQPSGFGKFSNLNSASVLMKGMQCENKKTSCASPENCLRISNDSMGCCPFESGALCPDKQHCCPFKSTCTLNSKGCANSMKDETSIYKVTLSKSIINIQLDDKNVSNVVCPDNVAVCPDGSTCCLMQSGDYGCCGSKNAVCCKDHIHCCPQFTTCDTAHSQCLQLTGSSVMKKILKIKNDDKNVSDVVCLDNVAVCPDGSTCCLMQSGDYGCCGSKNAVCCKDHIHCCPQFTTCDTAHSQCLQLTGSSVMKKILKIKNDDKNVSDVVCPDNVAVCPDGSTCCLMQSGDYGCCGSKNAVCCKDHIHCCPQFTTCDTAHSQCLQLTGSSVMKKILKIKNDDKNVSDVVCPDNVAVCPDGSTCCLMQSGDYGCCGSKNAVCCKDHIHCCPQFTTCDTAHSQCLQLTGSSVMKKKFFAKQAPSFNSTANLCPGEKKSCPSGFTCCKLPAGDYGCCPKSNAVCCKDHIHCCESGTRCSESGCEKVEEMIEIAEP